MPQATPQLRAGHWPMPRHLAGCVVAATVAAGCAAPATMPAPAIPSERKIPMTSIFPGSCALGPTAATAPRGGTFEYVLLTYELGSAGQVTAVRVVRSSGDADFDRAQAATLRQCRFSFPAGVDPAGATGSAVLVPLRSSVPGEMPSTARLDGPVITHVRSCAPGEPDYPAAMRYAREQGTSQLRFTVAPPGVLQFGELIASSGAGMLDVVALTKLSQCAFAHRPAEGSVPARHHMDVSYIWRME